MAPAERIRVALCDDHDLFRRMGEAATHEEAVALVCGLVPDVVLLDLEMPGGTMRADESMRAYASALATAQFVDHRRRCTITSGCTRT